MTHARARTTEEREALLKRWLRLMVERSTLDELSARPIAERIREFELMLEAADEAGLAIAAAGAAVSDGGAPAPGEAADALRVAGVSCPGGLDGELARRLAEHRATESPFTLALLAGGEDWRAALRRSGDADLVHESPGGSTAIVLPGLAGADARAAVDRWRVAAWRELGSDGRLAEVALASCPADAVDADGLVHAAQGRLLQVTGGEPRRRRFERTAADDREPVPAGGPAAAVVTPLPLPDSRLAPEWGPWTTRD